MSCVTHIGAENITRREAAMHIKTMKMLWDTISANWKDNIGSLLLGVMG